MAFLQVFAPQSARHRELSPSPPLSCALLSPSLSLSRSFSLSLSLLRLLSFSLPRSPSLSLSFSRPLSFSLSLSCPTLCPSSATCSILLGTGCLHETLPAPGPPSLALPNMQEYMNLSAARDIICLDIVCVHSDGSNGQHYIGNTAIGRPRRSTIERPEQHLSTPGSTTVALPLPPQAVLPNVGYSSRLGIASAGLYSRLSHLHHGLPQCHVPPRLV